MGIGYSIGALAPNIDVATGLAPVSVIPLMLFSGFLVNLDSITPVLSWIQWISVFKYIFEALMLNEFEDAAFMCTQSQIVSEMCPITNGNQVLQMRGLSPDNVVRDFAVSIGMVVFFWTAAFLCLRFKTKRAAAA
ncbi:MAG: hypothetical protein MHM6MM_007016 [Cercozoa sp. M6MM]